jgi:hypothetical protein
VILSQATDYEAQIEALDRRYQQALQEFGQTDDAAKQKSLTEEMIRLTLEKESLEAHVGRTGDKHDGEPSETPAIARSEVAEGPGLDRLIWWSPVIAVVVVFVIGSLVGRVIGLSPFVLALPAAIIAGIVTMTIRGYLQS